MIGKGCGVDTFCHVVCKESEGTCLDLLFLFDVLRNNTKASDGDLKPPFPSSIVELAIDLLISDSELTFTYIHDSTCTQLF